MGKTLGRGLMKHYIVVKWNELMTDKLEKIPEIRQIFDKTLEISGVKSVEIKENIINRDNRFDLMICIEMDQKSLPIYDESKAHHEWKKKFGKYIEKKAIFDSED